MRAKQRSVYWKHQRKYNKERIAASDVASLFHMNKYKSRKTLFLEKRHPEKARPEEHNIATRHGSFFEQFALGKTVQLFPGYTWKHQGSILDPWNPISFSPDLIGLGGEPQEMIGIETKCPYSAPIPREKAEISSRHLMQTFVCLMSSGFDRWILSYYDASTDRLGAVFEVRPDRQLWSETILPQIRQFLDGVQGDFEPASHPRKGKNDHRLEQDIRSRILEKTSSIHKEDYTHQEHSEPEGSP